MKKSAIALAALAALSLAGCQQETATSVMATGTGGQTATAADSSPVLATVNGQPITQRMVDIHTQQRNARRPGDAQNQNPQAVLEEVINLELVNQEANRQGVGERPDVVAQLAHQRRGLLAGITMQEYMAANPVSDEVLQTLYNEQFGASEEYKARHILLKTEDEAKDIIKQLDGGADFAELAKTHSTGPSGKNGGDLGWFSPKQMVPEFSAAAAGLEKGKYTAAPVQTQFGWHVILLEDTREATPPSFEQVAPQLRMVMQNQKLQEFLQGLRQTAKIEIVGQTAQ